MIQPFTKLVDALCTHEIRQLVRYSTVQTVNQEEEDVNDKWRREGTNTIIPSVAAV